MLTFARALQYSFLAFSENLSIVSETQKEIAKARNTLKIDPCMYLPLRNKYLAYQPFRPFKISLQQ